MSTYAVFQRAVSSYEIRVGRPLDDDVVAVAWRWYNGPEQPGVFAAIELTDFARPFASSSLPEQKFDTP